MSKRIKILYTIPNFDTAGSGKVVYDLARGLDTTKFEVAIACSHDRGKFFKEVQSLGIPIHIFQTTISYKPYGTLFFRLKPIIHFFKHNNFDIIHSWHWSSDWTEVLAARLSGVKWIYTKKAMKWGNRHWKIRSYLASFIITINDRMLDYFPKKKAQQLIPIGVDVDYYSRGRRIVNDNETSKNFKIVTIANLVPLKGIEILINAIHIMKDLSVKLQVVGDNQNDYGQELIRMCKVLQLENQVEFVDKVLDVRSFIENADLYVITTIDNGEGFGVALVEAMSMSIPVLGSNVSGINYILKDFPKYLYSANDANALALKISEIINLSQTERKIVGETLRNYVITNFSYPLFIKKHEVLYSQLSAKRFR